MHMLCYVYTMLLPILRSAVAYSDRFAINSLFACINLLFVRLHMSYYLCFATLQFEIVKRAVGNIRHRVLQLSIIVHVRYIFDKRVSLIFHLKSYLMGRGGREALWPSG